ncbi:hypothetical protein RQP46_006607 [Phenoliferia psychrophenolica]
MFRIQRPDQASSSRPAPSSRPSSSSRAPPPAWRNDDDSSEDEAPPKDELVSGFDAKGGLKAKDAKLDPRAASLTIASIPNRDWREAATARGAGKKKKKDRYIPDAVGGMRLGGQGVPQDARQATQGGMGTTDTINSTPVVGGLSTEAKPEPTISAVPPEQMDLDQPEKPASGDDEQAPPPLAATPAETEEQRAIRELISGGHVPAPAPLSVILPAAADERTAPLDEADAFRRDLLTRPDESTLDDYARVPVGQFGAALLRGMGWKEGTAASRTGRKGPVEAFVPTSRPALLGIGAKPIADVLGEETGRNGKPVRKDRREDMKFVPLVKREREQPASVGGGSGKSTPMLGNGASQNVDSPQTDRDRSDRDSERTTSSPPAVAPAAPAPSVEKPSSSTAGLKSFLSGGFGGVASVLVGQPFDLTKTRLQTAAPGAYKGTLDVVKQTLARDGVSGFYRGMGPPLAGVTPMFAVSFWGYAMGKKIVYSMTPERTSTKLTYSELAFAGFFSAIPTTFVAAPVERVKVLLQMQGQGGKQLYNGPLDAVSKLYKEGGLRSVFRGTGATIVRDGPGSAAYFVAYELVKERLTPEGQDPSSLSLGAVVIAGALAGVAMWTIAIPPDVIKSRLQGAPEGTYKGFVDCAVKTVKANGPSALFKGFVPAMARAGPANAACFLGVELSLQMMNKSSRLLRFFLLLATRSAGRMPTAWEAFSIFVLGLVAPSLFRLAASFLERRELYGSEAVLLNLEVHTLWNNMGYWESGEGLLNRRKLGNVASVTCGDGASWLSDAATTDVVLSIDAAYHFNTRDAFLRGAFKSLAPGGRLGLTDLVRSNDLGLGSTILLRIICLVSKVPWGNMVVHDEYLARLRQVGFSDVEVEDVSAHVFLPLATWIRERDAKYGRAFGSEWGGLMGFARVLEWWSRGSVRFVVVSAVKAPAAGAVF